MTRHDGQDHPEGAGGGGTLTTREACALTGLSDRHLRRLVTAGLIGATKDARGHLHLDAASLAPYREWEPIEAIERRFSGVAATEPGATSLAELTRRIAALERRVRTLEGHREGRGHQLAPAASEPYPFPPQPESAPAPRQAHGGDALPDGWVSAHELASQHDVSPSLVAYHARRGRFTFHEGRWKRRDGHGWVRHALDEDGQRAFHTLGLARSWTPVCPFCSTAVE
jgi:excisionase family DNA binding protein